MPRYHHRPKVTVTCATCGKVFTRSDRANQRHLKNAYCNPVCHGLSLQVPKEELLWRNVVRTEGEGCWNWVGNSKNRGYGRVKTGGKPIFAHRLSWELANGPIPEGKWVLHRCDNPACVRPDHLFLGDAAANNNDKCEKGRQTKGEQCWHLAKITKSDVIAIRQIWAEGGRTLQSIGDQFGIEKGTVWRITKRLIWKHVP